jgi:hypothetical protein
MISIIASLLAAPVMACANHMRGGWLNEYTNWIPGRPGTYIAILSTALLVFAMSFSWQLTIAGAWIYTAWAPWAWGRWFDMGHMPWNWNRTYDAVGFEKVIETISGWFGSYNVSPQWFDRRCMWMRHNFLTLATLPVAWWFGMWWMVPVAVVTATLIVASYDFAWYWKKNMDAISLAEFISGAVWGLFLIALCL